MPTYELGTQERQQCATPWGLGCEAEGLPDLEAATHLLRTEQGATETRVCAPHTSRAHTRCARGCPDSHMHACVVGASQIVSGFTILGMHLHNRDSSNGIVVDYANKQGRVKEGSRGRAVSAVIFDRRSLMGRSEAL